MINCLNGKVDFTFQLTAVCYLRQYSTSKFRIYCYDHHHHHLQVVFFNIVGGGGAGAGVVIIIVRQAT